MKQLATLLLLTSLSVPAALAQQADLAGTWAVERFTDPNAEVAPQGTISALLPENSYTLAPTRLRLSASGEARVTLMVTRSDGYEMVNVPATYLFENGRFVLTIEGFHLDWGLEQQDNALLMTAADGAVLALNRELP